MTLTVGDPYVGYAYAYPHKMAYRPLEPPVPLHEAWAEERKDALFLYFHVPYCEMRCGFCNLFSRLRPRADEVAAYLGALRRQAVRVREALGAATFALMAVGGGTPTVLGGGGLEALFDISAAVMGADPARAAASVETSPGTADAETLGVLAARGVRRVSLGVQSFDDRELAAIGRPERGARAHEALERIRAFGFRVLNVDLIYGIPGQTAESFLASIRAALRYTPEELYLYPLYVRPLTGMSRMKGPEEDRRLALYREARTFLLDRGYVQESMRMFRRGPAPGEEGPVYCCQDDGMVGLGCGARSYTRGLHYSTRYAVTARGVHEILEEYARQMDAEFGVAGYGIRLQEGERRRRWLIKSILRAEGMRLEGYAARFGSDALEDFPELAELEERGLARRGGGCLRLTAEGLELSDAIGPWLYSARIAGRVRECVLG